VGGLLLYVVFTFLLAGYRLTVDPSVYPSAPADLSSSGLALKTAGLALMTGFLLLAPALFVLAAPALKYESLRRAARRTHLWGAALLGLTTVGAFAYQHAAYPPVPANAQSPIGLFFAALAAGIFSLVLIGVAVVIHVAGRWLGD
jgi:heme/copper-type cytochrome/quinol oxidase subunit 3